MKTLQYKTFYEEFLISEIVLKPIPEIEFNSKIEKIINDNITKDQIDRMADATLKNERPLENAFGSRKLRADAPWL